MTAKFGIKNYWTKCRDIWCEHIVRCVDFLRFFVLFDVRNISDANLNLELFERTKSLKEEKDEKRRNHTSVTPAPSTQLFFSRLTVSDEKARNDIWNVIELILILKRNLWIFVQSTFSFVCSSDEHRWNWNNSRQKKTINGHN